MKKFYRPRINLLVWFSFICSFLFIDFNWIHGLWSGIQFQSIQAKERANWKLNSNVANSIPAQFNFSFLDFAVCLNLMKIEFDSRLQFNSSIKFSSKRKLKLNGWNELVGLQIEFILFLQSSVLCFLFVGLRASFLSAN